MPSWKKRFVRKNGDAVLLTANNAHWDAAPWTADGIWGPDSGDLAGRLRYKGVQHKEAPRPHEWQWWRLFKLYGCNLDCKKPSDGWRLWVYTRWGSLHFDLYIDRRKSA